MATARDHLSAADRLIALAEQKVKTAGKDSTGPGARIELRAESVTCLRLADTYSLAAIAAALVDLSGPDIALKTSVLVDDLNLPTNDEGPVDATTEPSA